MASATTPAPVKPRHHRRHRGPSRRPRPASLRPQRRRALRRHQRLHQVGARERRRCRTALPRPHDRGRRGPAVHRPAHHRAGVRRHRSRRPDRPRCRGRRGRRRAVHRHARGADPARTGGRAPRDRPEVERRLRRHRPGDRRRARGQGGAGAKHLRDAHYPGAKRLGHGKGYRYPHDDAIGVVAQEYLPESLRGAVYYEPTEHGNEREVSARLAKLRRIVRGGA